MPLEKREEVAREIKSTHFSLGHETSNSPLILDAPRSLAQDSYQKYDVLFDHS